MKNWIYFLIAILLAIDNVFMAKRIGFLSFDRLLEIVIFFYFLKQFFIEFKTNKVFKKFCLFVITFIALKLLMNIRFLLLNEKDFELIYIDLFKGFTFIMYAFLFLLVLKKGLEYVRVISWVHLLIIIFSLLHHPSSPVAVKMQEIKKTLLASNIGDTQFDNSSNEDTYIKNGLSSRFRMSGPFKYAIPFSYFAFSSFILTFFMYIKTRKKFYLIMIGLLFVCAFLSQTRSLILAFLLITGGYFYLKKEKNIKYKFYLYTATFFAIVPLILFISSISVESRVTQGSAHAQDDRPLFWAAGILAVMENPFGVTNEAYDEMKYYVYYKYGGGPALLELTSHNGLINVGFNYTFFGYIVFLFFTIFLLKNSSLSPPNLSLFFKLSLAGYLIHTSFHNNFIFYADYGILMLPILIGYESERYFNRIEENIKIS